MSIAANPIAHMPIGADPSDASTTKTPPRRTMTATSDTVLQPQPR